MIILVVVVIVVVIVIVVALGNSGNGIVGSGSVISSCCGNSNGNQWYFSLQEWLW